MSKVVIAGGNGCLGRRLTAHLVASGQYEVVSLDDFEGFWKGERFTPQAGTGAIKHVQARLAEWGDWFKEFDGADAVVHFAAWNPYPEATWEDSRLSMRMNSNVVAAAQRARVRRLVLASSSHVLGGYAQDGPCVTDAPLIDAETPLKGFTRFRLPGYTLDAVGYASAKLQLEEAGRAAAHAAPGLSVIIVRIGWCQPGENTPKQMAVTGTPTISAEKAAAIVDVEAEVRQGFDHRDKLLSWFQHMWLSTPDFQQLFKLCIDSKIKGLRIIWGTSRNTGMRFSTEGWAELGYEPIDDAERELESNGDCRSKRQRVE